MLPHIGLYYPFIHFRDERWLKTAALYWRELARVVPDGYRLSDSRTARVLREELGFIKPVDPAEPARQVAPMFLEVLTRHAEALHTAGYGVSPAWDDWDGRTRNPFDPVAPRSFGHGSRHTHGTRPERPGVAAAYWEEFTPELRAALMDSGLATDVRRGPGFRGRRSLTNGRWMAMDAGLAWVYTCAFVEVLARQGRYTPTTDQPDAHLASAGWDADRVAETLLGTTGTAMSAQPDNFADAVGLLAVRLAVPAGLDNVPVEKIVKLRENHRDEFAAFNAAVSQTVDELRQELAGVTLAVARESYVQMAVEQRFDAPLSALRDAMKAQGIGTVYGLANVKFEMPSVVSAFGPAVVGGFVGQPMAGTAVGAALAVVGARHTHKQQVKVLKAGNPAAYLLSVQRGLQPRSLLRKIASLA
ncbi:MULTISPECIES: DUF6236 family protein [unclassified Streptomyces]|uniref:DUF6236 family protein n=1 Tax=unclassified Streptomyces TaxID=2593676 RepID=UPI002E80B067|nr:DUF6236 family protein [Streptomyces sp. NBC_00589]WTI42352.1 DUF6236 family protein [Streptomyces sp. NBC_00775]WUB23966.1 DUF6236 family protein [Streptomyces sp. NBC_00589]